MLPYRIYTRKKIFNYYTGLSFFIFIWISRLGKDEVRLVRHEKIHFWQQVEMLFFLHWILYGLFYLVARGKGHCHYVAYRYNPFEIEAYNNDNNPQYLEKRRMFAWIRYIAEYQQAIAQNLNSTVPKDKLIRWW